MPLDFETLRWGNNYEKEKSLHELACAVGRGEVRFDGGELWPGGGRQYAQLQFSVAEPSMPSQVQDVARR